jgi:hypothetical protein
MTRNQGKLILRNGPSFLDLPPFRSGKRRVDFPALIRVKKGPFRHRRRVKRTQKNRPNAGLFYTAIASPLNGFEMAQPAIHGQWYLKPQYFQLDSDNFLPLFYESGIQRCTA